MALWGANSNAWPLSETIDKRAKRHSSGQLASLLAGGPETGKRFFAISVLAVISKPKKEKQESTRPICLYIITQSLKE